MRDITLFYEKDLKAFYQPCIVKLLHADYKPLKEKFDYEVENIFVLGYVRLNKDRYLELKILYKENNHLYETISIHPLESNNFIYDTKWINYENSILFEEENVMISDGLFGFRKKDDMKIKDLYLDWHQIF